MASYTDPILHATGDDLAVTDYNAVANNTTFLYQRPYIYAYNSTLTTVANGSITQVTLGSTLISGYGFSISSNNVIVPLTGIYSVSFCVVLAVGGGTTSEEFYANAYHNGSQTIYGSATPPTINNPASSGSGIIACTASDTIGLWAFQNAGGAINTVPSAALTFLSVYFVGSQ